MDTVKRVIIVLYKKNLFFVFPLLIIIPALIRTVNNTMTLFPVDDLTYDFYTYDDRKEKGNSRITKFSKDSQSVAFEFILGNKYKYPYAGFGIWLCDDSSMLDISGYDYLLIDIKSLNKPKLKISYYTFIKGFSVLDSSSTLRPMTQSIDLKKSVTPLKLPVDEFETPQWWYSENNITQSDIDKPDLSMVTSIDIENTDNCPKDKRFDVEITGIYFQRNNIPVYIVTLLCIAIYFLTYFIVIYLCKKLASPVVIPYQKLTTENYFDKEVERIVNYIAKNYKYPSMSVSDLGKAVGINREKIPTVLKKKFNMSFKQYLNKIRLSEAKRLLRESDLQVSDIAEKVGYNNVTHFHRIFKWEEGVSPKKYRDVNNA